MREFGLIGYPLGHSFSKAYFSDKFAKLGITDCHYELYPIEYVEQLDGLLDRRPELEGLNVTIPHKETVIALLNDLSDEAREIGAVNCIRIRNGQRVGYNTDAYGFHQSIKPFLEPVHDRALILGTGGASKAVAYVLRQIGIDYLFVSRNPQGTNQVGYDQLNEFILRHHRFIINTTPLGTFPDVDSSPALPVEFLGTEHFVADLIYNPENTALLRDAKSKGAMTLNGLSMLRHQAEKSWEIWNS